MTPRGPDNPPCLRDYTPTLYYTGLPTGRHKSARQLDHKKAPMYRGLGLLTRHRCSNSNQHRTRNPCSYRISNGCEQPIEERIHYHQDDPVEKHDRRHDCNKQSTKEYQYLTNRLHLFSPIIGLGSISTSRNRWLRLIPRHKFLMQLSENPVFLANSLKDTP